MLKQKINDRELQGLKIQNNGRLCHQLFVDDTGLFLEASEKEFTTARDSMKQYDNISGALLNVQKLKIIPICLLDGKYPAWFQYTGCSIAKEGEITEYLGCPIGYKVKPSHEVGFLLGKMRR